LLWSTTQGDYMADKIVRYKIEITKITHWKETNKKNLIVEKTPTGQKKNDGYGREETIYAEKYAVGDTKPRG
jgi:hypothetical protein